MGIDIETMHNSLLNGYRGRGSGKTLAGLLIAIQSGLALDGPVDLKIKIKNLHQMRYMEQLCYDVIHHLELSYKYQAQHKMITVIWEFFGFEKLRISPWIGDTDRLRGLRPLIVFFDGNNRDMKQEHEIEEWRQTKIINVEDGVILIQE